MRARKVFRSTRIDQTHIGNRFDLDSVDGIDRALEDLKGIEKSLKKRRSELAAGKNVG